MEELFVLALAELLNVLEFQNYIMLYVHKVFVAPSTINERINIKFIFYIFCFYSVFISRMRDFLVPKFVNDSDNYNFDTSLFYF